MANEIDELSGMTDGAKSQINSLLATGTGIDGISYITPEAKATINRLLGGGAGVVKDIIERTATAVTLPEGTQTIGAYAFYGCDDLATVTMSDTLTTIDDYAFSGCSSLESVTIPATVISIGNYAFEDCALESVTILATTPPTLKEYSLSGVSCDIFVPADSVETYQAASRWSTYSEQIKAITE